MGMTDDLEVAVAEGATIVRVGTAIFGPRPALASAYGKPAARDQQVQPRLAGQVLGLRGGGVGVAGRCGRRR